MTDRQRLDLKLNVLVIMSVTEDTIGICIPCLVILCRAWLSIMSVTYIPCRYTLVYLEVSSVYNGYCVLDKRTVIVILIDTSIVTLEKGLLVRSKN